MRNEIKVIDPVLKTPTLQSLEVGEMFRYIGKNDQNVYMKVQGETFGSIVLLSTGTVYNQVTLSKEVERIGMIQISRPL